jgi:uncharacterized membrane protein (UPF0136 family)
MCSRAIKTRSPIPIALAAAGTASTAYYGKAVRDFNL